MLLPSLPAPERGKSIPLSFFFLSLCHISGPTPIVHVLRGYLLHECTLICQSFEHSLLLARRDASAHFPHLFLLLSLSRLMRRSTSGLVPNTVTMTTTVIMRRVIRAANGLPLRRGSNYISRGGSLKMAAAIDLEMDAWDKS